MSMDKSQLPVTDDRDQPPPAVSASSYPPQRTGDVRDKQPDRAVEALEPNRHTVFGVSDAPSPQISLADSQDLSRMSAISGLSEDLIRSLSSGSSKQQVRSPTDLAAKPLPSPTARPINRTPGLSATLEKSIKKDISKPVAVSDTLGFTYKPPEAPERARPTRTAISARRSMFVEDLGEQNFGQSQDRRDVSGEASKSTATITEWPLPTPTASPALGIRFQDSSTAVDDSEASDVRAQSPQQTATPYSTIINPDARKSPRLNLLPKFLRAKSQDEYKIEPAIEERSHAEEAASPKSFFDDGSSDGGEDSQIESAQQAIVASPVMVKHGSSSRVGLHEMLSSTPPKRNNGLGPSSENAARLVGEKHDNSDVRRLSARNIQEHEDAMGSNDGRLSSGLWKETFKSSALKSKRTSPYHTPMHSPSSNAKAPRKVSFPAPPPLEIKPDHRFLRQSIVSTPYPSGDDDKPHKRTMSVQSTKQHKQRLGDMGSESVLTLVVYSNNGTHPKVKRIVIPNPRQTTLVDESTEKNPPIRATISREFDDEKLFKLIRKEYSSMRGCLKQVASARTVRSINLLSYQSTSQLVSQHAKPMHPDFKNEDGDFTESRILKLFLTPKTGRKRNEWTQWIRSQPENSIDTHSETNHVALELVEGWSPGKLYIAVATVLVCSLAATILWIFLGNKKANLPLEYAFGAGASLNRPDVGYRGAGDRVGSGAVLGLLVLFFGWTAVGAWILLSWLIC